MDWGARYREGNTPWDVGGPHPELAARLARGEAPLRPPRPGARALVPGCGRGHDALALARAGWRVTAVDLVPELGAELGPALAATGGRFIAGDALRFDDGQPYELFFEHTFFSAIEPAQRPQWGALVRRQLAPGGWLAAVAFPADRPDAEGGPPWRTTAALLAEALGPDFALRADEPVRARTQRGWEERWTVFEWTAAQSPRA